MILKYLIFIVAIVMATCDVNNAAHIPRRDVASSQETSLESQRIVASDARASLCNHTQLEHIHEVSNTQHREKRSPNVRRFCYPCESTGIQISTRGRPFPNPTPLKRYENAETPVTEALSEVTELLNEYYKVVRNMTLPPETEVRDQQRQYGFPDIQTNIPESRKEQEESLKDLYKNVVKVVAHFERIVDDHVTVRFHDLTHNVYYGFLRTCACAVYTLVWRHLEDVDCDQLTTLNETFVTPHHRFYRDYVVVDYAQRLLSVVRETITELKARYTYLEKNRTIA